MDAAFDGASSGSFDHEGLRKLVAEARHLLESATAAERAPLARAFMRKLLHFADHTQDRTLAARALCAAAEESEDTLSDTEAAIDLFGRALELNPALERAATQLDILLQRQNGNGRRCVVLQQRATALDKDPVASESMRAAAWRHAAAAWTEEESRREEAIEAYEKAIILDPEVDSLEALADLYSARGREGDEEQAADLLTSVAEALEGGEAIHYAQRALDLLPDHDEAMALLETLVPQSQQGRILRSRLERYIEAAGGDEDADPRRIRLARIYGSEGRLQQALNCLKPAVDRGDTQAVWTRRELLESALGDSKSLRDGETLVGVPLQSADDDGDVAVTSTKSNPARPQESAPLFPPKVATTGTVARAEQPTPPRRGASRPVAAASGRPPAPPTTSSSPARSVPPPVPFSVSSRPPQSSLPALKGPSPFPPALQAPILASTPLADELTRSGRQGALPGWLPWLVGGLVVAATLAFLLNS